jgi:hypothetical protein
MTTQMPEKTAMSMQNHVPTTSTSFETQASDIHLAPASSPIDSKSPNNDPCALKNDMLTSQKRGHKHGGHMLMVPDASPDVSQNDHDHTLTTGMHYCDQVFWRMVLKRM